MFRRAKKEPEKIECGVCAAIANYESVKKPWDAKSITVASVSGALAAGILAATASFVAPAFRKVCVPYVPATSAQVHNLLSALRGRTGTLLDIGSGDGRIVIAASKEGFKSHGVELNYWLVLYSRYKAWQEGQRRSTAFYRKDLWKTDLSKYDNIVVFGTEPFMIPLEKKFEREINPNCTVLAARHPLPNWQAQEVIGSGLESVWVYRHPDSTDFTVKTRTEDINESSVQFGIHNSQQFHPNLNR